MGALREEEIQKLNQLRKSTVKKIIIVLLPLIIFNVLAIRQIIESSPDMFQIYIFVLIISIMIYTVLYRLVIKKYRKKFKIEMMSIAIEEFGHPLEYSMEGLPKRVAEKTNMFGRFTVYKSEDLVSGSIDGVSFESSDVKLGYYTGSGKNRRYVRVCHGQLYVFDFPKNFTSKLILRERNILSPSGLKRVKLESIEFNKQFYIYSDNEHEAFYILTPHFMEKLMILEKRHPGNLFLAFDQNRLYIGIDNNLNRFEPPILNAITEETLSDQLYELKLIKDIIKVLNLNQDIFK